MTPISFTVVDTINAFFDRHLCGKQAGKQLEKREDLLRVAGLYDAAEAASGGELPRHGC